MNQVQLLAKLSDFKRQAQQYDVAPHARPPFDAQLFFTQSEKLLPYVQELEKSYQQLCHGQDSARKAFFSERFINQLQALQHVIDSISHSVQNPSNQSLLDLRADLAQHKEWERKLCQLVRSKEREASGTSLQIKMQDQVTIAQQRLNRCRQAIYQLEESIAQQEGFVHGQQKY